MWNRLSNLCYKSRSGWIKMRYRKRYFIFGEKVYIIKARIFGKRTHMIYHNKNQAAEIYNTLKSIMLK